MGSSQSAKARMRREESATVHQIRFSLATIAVFSIVMTIIYGVVIFFEGVKTHEAVHLVLWLLHVVQWVLAFIVFSIDDPKKILKFAWALVGLTAVDVANSVWMLIVVIHCSPTEDNSDDTICASSWVYEIVILIGALAHLLIGGLFAYYSYRLHQELLKEGGRRRRARNIQMDRDDDGRDFSDDPLLMNTEARPPEEHGQAGWESAYASGHGVVSGAGGGGALDAMLGGGLVHVVEVGEGGVRRRR